ncbi:hypothetical protein ABIB25_004781 [Nakamurella sp. UYEF19]|uniref:hypothetical protein n=1 Tax=Nakamurella sp. UYEF19 TaxID=1756392 RepID=UPI00339219CE
MTTREQNSPSIHRATGRTSAFAAVRDSYRERRSVRALHQRVERELSTYTTQADIQELDAMLERSGTDVSVYTQMIERIRLRAA